ncbi:MAG TPA: hypothetical protein VM535_01955, partial [Candidatus Saccharimonadales bacterium]|nr:hypothetical protein [Candidatus Saccharimonadales bacterium]
DAEAAVHQPGRNEQQSAQLVGERMQAAGYEEPAVQRVADAIIKTTAQRTPDGVIKQTFIREGSKDILGLCVGQADMNGILIEGPGELFSDAYALYLECSQTPLMNVLTNPRGTIDALRDEKEYLASRVAALPGDLAYYVADPTEREAIKQIYYQEFSSVSRAALEVAERLHGAPEKTREVVSSSFSWAGRVAQRGLSQVVAAERHMLDQVKRDDD